MTYGKRIAKDMERVEVQQYLSLFRDACDDSSSVQVVLRPERLKRTMHLNHRRAAETLA